VPATVALAAQTLPTGRAALTLDLPAAAEVELSLFDFAGRRIAVLRRGPEGAGQHAYVWSAASPSGIYLARARVRTAEGLIERTTRVLLVH